MKFSKKHLLNKFSNIQEESCWWIGRLAKIDSTTETLYIKTPLAEIGLITGYVETTIGKYAEVYFGSIQESSWISISYLLIQEE